MKKLIISLSSSLFLFAAYAGEVKLVGKVHSLSGEAFIVEDGQARTLRPSSDVHEGARILVSDGGRVTIGDFHDGRHHLTGGTHLSAHADRLVLQKGALWTQAMGRASAWAIHTPNLVLQGRRGEWVTTYNPASRRSQVTTISGEVDVASPQEPSFKYAVAAGMFTFADPAHEDGYPRSPTKLGMSSLMRTLAMFPGVKSNDAGLARLQQEDPKRAPASVSEGNRPKGEVTFFRTVEKNGTMPSSLEGQAHSYLLKKSPAIRKPKVAKQVSVAPVKIYGFQQSTAPTARRPASSGTSQSPRSPHSGNTNDFSESYRQHEQKQPKNSQEVQSLVDDLKSF
jgi:hypothetical protein